MDGPVCLHLPRLAGREDTRIWRSQASVHESLWLAPGGLGMMEMDRGEIRLHDRGSIEREQAG